jgi:tetratricopeptide (TPR) repeat protein
MKKIKMFIVASSALVIQARAQDFNSVSKAFSASYTLEQAKSYDKAAQEIQKIYSENNYEQNLRLGWLNYEASKLDESVRYYTKAIQISPSSIEAKFGIVYPLSALNKWDEVMQQYLAIIAIDPKQPLANYRIGLIYYKRKQYEKASPYFETYRENYPFDYDALLMCGWNNYRKGELVKAKEFFQRALLNKPDDSSANEGLSLLK